MRFAIANFSLTAGFFTCASSWDLLRRFCASVRSLRGPALGVRRQQRFAINNAVQFHFDKAADASQLHDKSFHAKGDKRREIERKRRLPAAVQHAVIFDVVQVEVIGERVETAMHVVAALKKNSRSEKARNSSIGVAKRMDSDEKKVGDERLDHRMQAAHAITSDKPTYSSISRGSRLAGAPIAGRQLRAAPPVPAGCAECQERILPWLRQPPSCAW